LGDLEAEIMELVWQRPAEQGVTVREVFETLYERRRLAYTTVMSTMARLAKKRLLRVSKVDHAYVYYPAISEAELVSHFVGRILDDLLVNFSGVTFERLAHLAEPATASRLDELSHEIQARRAQWTAPTEQEATQGGDEDAQNARERS